MQFYTLSQLCYTHGMATQYRLQVKGAALLERSGEPNANQFAHKVRVSAQTGYRYTETPERVLAFDAGVLARILTLGLGLTPEQALELKIGDLFEFVEVKND